jgi:hypothetical protein
VDDFVREIRLLFLATFLFGAFAPAAFAGPEDDVDLSNADRCDFLDPAVCLYPFPNGFFTTGSGAERRLNLNPESMPKNVAGQGVDPSAWNRNDGFSPGQLIVTKVPGLDTPAAFRKTRAVPVTDMRQTYRRNQPIVVIDTKTSRRHLIWSELDANAESPEDVVLQIRPGRNFAEGRRYIVALRNLKDAQGRTIAAQPGFRIYRDRLKTDEPAIENRRAHFESIFRTLRRAHIARRDLYLAWDFTVASERNLSERMLAVRNDAFAQLGDTTLGDLQVQGESPQFLVTDVQDYDESENRFLMRRVEGRVMVPCYLDMPACPPGSSFNYGEGNIPAQLPGNMQAAVFICNIPRIAAERPVKPSLYGHGLLGDASEVDSEKLQRIGNKYGFVFCATDWSGMSSEDLPNVGTILTDVSRLDTLADRGQQGMLNFLYLGRAMIHPDGFSSDPAFQAGGKSVIDTARLHYVGGSQGGIMGGGLAPFAPDYTRAYLGVPGMNYSTLLTRSSDFDEYSVVMYASYRNEIERPLLFSLVQILWDRAEADGYAHHMVRDPYPDTPLHRVLLHEAFGDHQVANVATEVEARTIRAPVRRPMVDPGRSRDRRPWYGIPRIRRFPFSGPAALVVGEIGPLRTENGEEKGTPAPPTTNTPNTEGVDPHGPDFSETPAGQKQIARFLLTGRVFEVCPRGVPCYLDGWKGPSKKKKRRR